MSEGTHPPGGVFKLPALKKIVILREGNPHFLSTCLNPTEESRVLAYGWPVGFDGQVSRHASAMQKKTPLKSGALSCPRRNGYPPRTILKL